MHQTSPKIVQDKVRLDKKGGRLGILQEIKIWSYYQLVYA